MLRLLIIIVLVAGGAYFFLKPAPQQDGETITETPVEEQLTEVSGEASPKSEALAEESTDADNMLTYSLTLKKGKDKIQKLYMMELPENAKELSEAKTKQLSQIGRKMVNEVYLLDALCLNFCPKEFSEKQTLVTKHSASVAKNKRDGFVKELNTFIKDSAGFIGRSLTNYKFPEQERLEAIHTKFTALQQNPKYLNADRYQALDKEVSTHIKWLKDMEGTFGPELLAESRSLRVWYKTRYKPLTYWEKYFR